MLYKAWYGKNWQSDVHQEYVYVRDVDARNLDDAFEKMQAEYWSPHGEARFLITKLGLQHTSMSVGDILQDADGDLFIVEIAGFKHIKEFPNVVKRI